MINLVLYRKYRPQTFKEFVGQTTIVKILTNTISVNMLSHAYLFVGPRGCGKTTMARLLAKAINCLNRKNNEFEPCNQCSSCLEIQQGRSVDLIEIDAASHRGIDEARELRKETRFNPIKAKYKVYILDEAHQLTPQAFNALLKTLEEPLTQTIFILVTTEGDKILPTVASRCQRLDFDKFTLNQIINRLENLAKLEKVKIEKQVLNLIALNSEGSMRDAEGLLEEIITLNLNNANETIKIEDVRTFLGIPEIKIVSQFVDYLNTQQSAESIAFLNKIYQKGTDLQKFLKLTINYLRELLILKINPDINNPLFLSLTEEEQRKMKTQANKFEELKLYRILNLFLETTEKMKYSSIPQLPIELAIIEISKRSPITS